MYCEETLFKREALFVTELPERYRRSPTELAANDLLKEYH
jgi:hypothetical protein